MDFVSIERKTLAAPEKRNKFVSIEAKNAYGTSNERTNLKEIKKAKACTYITYTSNE